MKKFATQLIITLLNLALGLPIVTGQTPPTKIITKFQSILDTCAEASAPGAVMYVEKPNQWSYTWKSGVANISNNQAIVGNEKFRIGSVSKNFLATCILKLASQNSLTLNDPISRWLPTTITSQIPNAERMTIRRLLLHTTGIGDYVNNLNSGLYDDIYNNRFKTYSFDTLFQKYYKRIAASNTFPDDSARYSNTNYLLLGEIVKRVSGLPYDQYMKQNIITPLGLTNTSVPALSDSTIGLPYLHGYDVDTANNISDWSYQNVSWANSAGSVISNAKDLGIYYKSLRTGGIIPTNWVDSMMTFRAFDVDLPSVQTYGYGIFRIKAGPYLFVGHTGGLPGYGSMMFYLPNYDLYVTGNFTATNGDVNCVLRGISDFMKVYTSIATLNTDKDAVILPSPNPADAAFSFDINAVSALTISNAQGQIVVQKTLAAGQHTIETTTFPNGMYMVSVYDAKRQIRQTKKLMVMH
jgi:D-alanyl-D-alanine carboxypeptidase